MGVGLCVPYTNTDHDLCVFCGNFCHLKNLGSFVNLLLNKMLIIIVIISLLFSRGCELNEKSPFEIHISAGIKM